MVKRVPMRGPFQEGWAVLCLALVELSRED